MRRLLALLLCLMLLPCAALAADDTVLVEIEEGSGFTVAENGLRVLPGEDAVFTVTMERGVLLTGTDYAGDTDRYLRALAAVNNAVAACADAVVRVVCGLPVYYKGSETE